MKKTIANRSHNIHNTNYGHLDISMWYTYKNFISQFYLTISLMMKMFTQWYWSCCFCNSIKGLHDKSDERCCIVLGRYICIGAVMRWPFSDNAQWIYLNRYHNLSQRRESYNIYKCNLFTYAIPNFNSISFFREQMISCCVSMMTSSNGNIFRVTGHLCGEFTGPRWIPRTKASDAELSGFLWSAS